MHIVFVESAYADKSGKGGGGAGTYIRLIGRELIKVGHDVTVITDTDITENETVWNDKGIEVHSLHYPYPILWYLYKISYFRWMVKSLMYLATGYRKHKKLRSINKIHPIDIVEYTEGGDFWNAFLHKWPYITHLHGSSFTFNKNSGQVNSFSDRLNRKLEHYFICRANYTVSPSAAMILLVEEELGKKLRKKVAIPLPLDFYTISSRSEKSNNGINISFVSRNDPVKGGWVLLKAIKLLNIENENDYTFNFYGYIPEKDLDIPKNLHIISFMPRDELLNELHNSDIFIVPSIFDNSPFTVYEAMAAGKPVIGSNVGGIPELIDDGITGLLFNSGDYIQLANSIKKLANDYHLREKMGIVARKKIYCRSEIQNNLEKRLTLWQYTIDSW